MVPKLGPWGLRGLATEAVDWWLARGRPLGDAATGDEGIVVEKGEAPMLWEGESGCVVPMRGDS